MVAQTSLQLAELSVMRVRSSFAVALAVRRPVENALEGLSPCRGGRLRGDAL